ncbi:MAG: hypothetical protein MUO68_17885 [Desulfobacteraceae bacterium]|nr:hypothetical protein [Desulfobacteraceae bacterium]
MECWSKDLGAWCQGAGVGCQRSEVRGQEKKEMGRLHERVTGRRRDGEGLRFRG